MQRKSYRNLNSSSSRKIARAPVLLCWTAALALSFAGVRELAARPGDLDPTFGSGGKVQTAFGVNSSYGHDIALQPDGKVLVAGYSGVYPGFNSALARYLSDGSIDSTFGTNGTVITPLSTTDMFNAVAVQSDGKIVAVGSAAVPPNGAFHTAVLVARYDSNGTLDLTFGNKGAIITALPGDSSAARDVAVLADGRILVGAYAVTVDFARMALLRFDSAGALDPTFGTGGYSIIEFPAGGYSGGAYATALALQPDGKAILVGTYEDDSFSEVALARVNSDGRLDGSFGVEGKLTTSLGSGDAVGSSVVVQPDGRIVAGGYFEGATKHDFAVVRYLANGTVDRSYGRAGIAINDLANNTDDLLTGLVLQSDDTIIAVGWTGNYPSYDFGIVRYTTTGRLDKTFGRRGTVSTNFGFTTFGSNSYDIPYAAVTALDGKIVAAGASDANTAGDFDFALARYLIH